MNRRAGRANAPPPSASSASREGPTMPITFACPRCGKSYSVDPAALAGRKGKCKACAAVPMTIPTFYDDGDDTIATEGYGLSAPVAAAVAPEEQTVFVPAGRDPDERSPPRHRKRPTGGASRPDRGRREDDEPFHVRHRASLLGGPDRLTGGPRPGGRARPERDADRGVRPGGPGWLAGPRRLLRRPLGGVPRGQPVWLRLLRLPALHGLFTSSRGFQKTSWPWFLAMTVRGGGLRHGRRDGRRVEAPGPARGRLRRRSSRAGQVVLLVI